MPRSNKVFKKRKPTCLGNRKVSFGHQNQNNVDLRAGGDCSSVEDVARPRPISNPSPSVNPPKRDSASKKKVGDNLTHYQEYLGSGGTYDVVNLEIIQDLLGKIAVCLHCGEKLSLAAKDRLGLGFTIEIICLSCNKSVSRPNSTVVSSGKADINLRLAYAFRCVGVGEQGARTFCGVMNMPNPPSFKYYSNAICNATKEVCLEAMKSAGEEAVEVENGGESRDISIALDGTWQKRGHVSQNGVVTAISVPTGKVIDAEIMSKHCRCPKRFDKEHNPNCAANYSGSSGGMEVAGVVNIFNRSETLHNVRYKNFLGDGDTASYSTVSQLKPYGPDFSIQKLECVGHVQKRMSTRLIKLKAKKGKQLLSDKKTIGGRGRLTGAAIKQISIYYGLAIRRNTSSLQKMEEAVRAVYWHLCSTNQKPYHELCPKGADSWCKFQKAKAKNEIYDHKEHFHIPITVMAEIKPIFKDLGAKELLKKCLHGGTQNPSESLNNMIWSRIPKRTFVMLSTLEIGVYDAIACFNIGNIARCKILAKLGIVPGKNCVNALKKLDEARIAKAEKAMDELVKRCRQKSTLAKRRLEDEYEADEDPDNPAYGAGMH